MTAAQTFAIVLGFPRSGTTLLSRLLDHHPEISCPPEPYVTTACARFISEDVTDGLPVGVLSGLAFSDIGEDEVVTPLRELARSLHRKMARGKPVMVEKTAFDIFYLDEIERIFAGHAKFICVRRNPLDVITSVKDLSDEVGVYLRELRDYIAANPSPLAAFAEAWAERNAALDAFIARHPEDCVDYRYEDLLTRPEETLRRVTGCLGVAPMDRDQIEAALQAKLRIGLGDWKIYKQTGFDPTRVERWKEKLSKPALTRVLPILAEAMTRYGYAVPYAPRPRDRITAVRQFKAMTSLKRSGLGPGK